MKSPSLEIGRRLIGSRCQGRRRENRSGTNEQKRRVDRMEGEQEARLLLRIISNYEDKSSERRVVPAGSARLNETIARALESYCGVRLRERVITERLTIGVVCKLHGHEMARLLEKRGLLSARSAWNEDRICN